MSAVANGVACVYARVTIPWLGVPMAIMSAPETVTPVNGLVTLVVEGLTIALTMRPGRFGTFANQWQGFGVGGRNGWGKPLPSKGYRSPFGVMNAQVFADAARECGELPPVVQTPLPIAEFYTRRGGAPASQVFDRLPAGQLWWVDPTTGITQVGIRPPSVVRAPFDVIGYDTSKGRLVIATDAPEQFVPNATFTDPNAGTFTVNSVVWTDEGQGLRGEVWLA